mmetsp:Transcript_36521/g.68027  ORF Transcript_36521/g.68027 Transcript_36521/m.68027 type:complete len:112 (-) Transcript_36521:69-404(-)
MPNTFISHTHFVSLSCAGSWTDTLALVTGHTDIDIQNSSILPLIIYQVVHKVVPVLRDHAFRGNQENQEGYGEGTSHPIWDSLDGLVVKYRRANESLKNIITEQISVFMVD